MAGLLKVISYKMTLEIGRLKKGHFIGVKKKKRGSKNSTSSEIILSHF